MQRAVASTFLTSMLPSAAAAGIFSRCMSSTSRVITAGLIRISEEVQSAVVENRPVVALESTIITHGMPYPTNIQTARNVERICRENGAIPATCAVLSGRLCVGLTDTEIEYLAEAGQKIMKTSSRDIAYVLSKGFDGSLTVAGTLVAARSADISVLCTGGVGGVHRGATESMDVSADLLELSRSHVAVICSGVKSILDIGLTLEYLETLGVTVATFDADREFPAFFVRSSGFKAPYDMTTAAQAAKLIDCSRRVGELRGGQLIAVPVPEKHSADRDSIERAIEGALKEARAAGVAGKDVTPFLLARVNDLLKGKSLASNIALIENNAKVASHISVELCKLRRVRERETEAKYEEEIHHISIDGSDDEKIRTAIFNFVNDKNFRNHQPSCDMGRSNKNAANVGESNIVVVGGINYDIVSTFSKEEVAMDGTTNKGRIYQTFGGVGRNLAYCLARLDQKAFFISAVGSDLSGLAFKQHHAESLQEMSGVDSLDESSTAVYVATVASTGELIHGLGDFDIHSRISPQMVSKHKERLERADLVCLDGNIPAATIDYVTNICQQCNIPVWFEPTDVNHVTKLFQSDAWKRLTCASPNLRELEAMGHCLREILPSAETKSLRLDGLSVGGGNAPQSPSPVADLVSHCARISLPLLCHIPHLLVTLGQNGVLHLFTRQALTSLLLSGGFIRNGKASHNEEVSSRHSDGSNSSSFSAAIEMNSQNSRYHSCSNTQQDLSASGVSSVQNQTSFLSTSDLKDPKGVLSLVMSLFCHGTVYSWEGSDIWAAHYPAVPYGLKINDKSDTRAPSGVYQEPVSVSGAGDCLAAAYIARVLAGEGPDSATRSAVIAASLSLQSSDTVPSTISTHSIRPRPL